MGLSPYETNGRGGVTGEINLALGHERGRFTQPWALLMRFLYYFTRKICCISILINSKRQFLMRKLILCSLLSLLVCGMQAQPNDLPPIEDFTRSMQAYEGYFPFYWDGEQGKIWLEINRWEEEFLHVNALSAGVGSNDIGLDRGQLGGERVVYFTQVGPKVLLVQPNLEYRASSDNPFEVRAVKEAFAQSVLAGFPVKARTGTRMLVDLTPMLMNDAHGVTARLSRTGQGSYRLDQDRSVVYLDRTKNFPFNSEFEAMLTFAGTPEGGYIRSVTPDPSSVTVRLHHSFIQLPDTGYTPRVFDPRAGYYPFSYEDYATPIDETTTQRFITRHRLAQENPGARKSPPVEPIIYYVDPGAPEPIRSALIEGASWWNEAFEAAGYENAFRVEVLPDSADPLDVRYNVIQWVHRSTRGWSYGSSVTDPRTGEIIKGHVSLGSLRVRQDFLLAQGLIEAYEEGREPNPALEEMALARLRQLSAHEVGHTLGLSHNYIASSLDRASVMDYPHPYVKLQAGAVDFDEAYDVGIGEWDKRAIIYGYRDFAPDADVAAELQEILEENEKEGLTFLSDAEARPRGSAHPETHLWDNGEDATQELDRLIKLRQQAIEDFSAKNIPVGAPMALMEDVLVPLYFMHRYQTEAVAKVIGGRRYRYQVRGDNQPGPEVVAAKEQEKALETLMKTLEPEFIGLPVELVSQIPPRPIGYPRGREHFNIRTGFTLDPLGIAETSADMTLGLVLHPQRANRLVEFRAYNEDAYGLLQLQDELVEQIFVRRLGQADRLPQTEDLRQVVEKALVKHLIHLALQSESSPQTVALTRQTLRRLSSVVIPQRQAEAGTSEAEKRAHLNYCRDLIERYFTSPQEIELPETEELPDGSPIGMCPWQWTE